MVVDDSQLIRVRLTKLLSEHGYEVIGAKDGEEAVETYLQLHPDAVLMDFAMPRKHGLTALRELRRLDPDAKVILLTAMDQQAIALRAMQAGAKDFLIKPYDPEQLLAALRKVLGASQ